MLLVTVTLLGTSQEEDEYADGPMICLTDSASGISELFATTIDDMAIQTLAAKPVMLYDLAGEQMTVIVTCSYKCPCSDGYAERLAELRKKYEPLGVSFVAIHSNVDETMNGIKAYKNRNSYPLDIYRDEGAILADVLDAAVTPEAFVFSPDWKLRYHGRIDDDKGGLFVEEKTLQLALDTLLTGKDLIVKEKLALGCAIVRNPV